MNIKLLIAIIILPFLSITVLTNELVPKTILNGKAEIKIPRDFGIMSEEFKKIKYPSDRRPTLAYSNESGGINLVFNLTQNKADQASLESYKDVLESSLRNAHPSANWKNVGFKVINGRKVGYLELITPAIDTKIYNLMFFTDLNGQLLLGSFNCTEKDMKNWTQTAHQIMNSLKIK